MQPRAEDIVGRADDLRVLEAFLAAPPPAALVLDGEPGIGKTTLWQAAIHAALARGHRVLQTRPSEAESRLPFVGLGDLLANVPAPRRDALPPPQRYALRVALLEEDPEEGRVDARTIGVALLAVLTRLAEAEDVLVAIDDLQWLDSSSADALTFAARRVPLPKPVRFLLARRQSDDSRPLGLDYVDTREVRPLSLGALHRLLRTQLDLSLPGQTLRRVADISGGNPFYALELGRAVRASGDRTRVDLPRNRRRLIADRFAALSEETRDALLLASLATDVGIDVLGGANLQPAVDAGIVEVSPDRVTFAHPLYAAFAAESASEHHRAAAHLQLAAVASDPEQRAWHLAAAAGSGPEANVALALDEAARRAQARGAPATAAIFAERALELTPQDDVSARTDRLCAAMDYNGQVTHTDRVRALFEAVQTTLHGRDRARAIAAALQWAGYDRDRTIALCHEALVEAADDAELRARLRCSLGWQFLLGHELRAALAAFREAARDAQSCGDAALEVFALVEAGGCEALIAVADAENTLRRALEIERALPVSDLLESARLGLGILYVWRDQYDEARAQLLRRHRDLAARGNEGMLGPITGPFARLELRAGNWTEASRWIERAEEIAEQADMDQFRAGVLTLRATIAAYRGDLLAAHRLAEESTAIETALGYRWFSLQNSATRGFAHLCAREHGSAATILQRVLDELDSIGVEEPGFLPVEGDLVEALVGLARFDDAERVVNRLEARGRALDRPRARATAARGRGIVCAARKKTDAALEAFADALGFHEQFTAPFERARTLLVLGMTQRRAKQLRAARDTLESATAIFDDLGASLFASRAREELASLAGRRPANGLTPTEERVARLAAEGLTNREVAEALVVSVSAVEAHLTRIYAKLGVRSRTQLARRFAA